MCLNPVEIKCADGVHTMKVPCGHCLQCVRNYQQQWVARLSEEAKSWRNSDGSVPAVFFTLTYSPENIPKNFLHLTTSGVFLAKQPLFNLPPVEWNTTLKESGKDADRRQNAIQTEWKADLQVYLDNFPPSDACEDFDNDADDLPAWMFEGTPANVGTPLSKIVAFNTVRYSDVREWIKKCRVYWTRKMPTTTLIDPKTGLAFRDKNGSLVHYNGRYVASINDKLVPRSAIPACFKYFICSEYGPRTLRPHYHGILFGVTADEFRDIFLPLWRFGHVDYSQFDSTKGGMMYVGKYCSKGSYDNPLSKKDFFYKSGKEFHSDKFIGSLERFGVNMPLADPTFRMMSHGIGIGYAFRPNVQKYWGVTIDDDYIARSIDVCRMPCESIFDMPNSPWFKKDASVYQFVHYEEPMLDLFDKKEVDFVASREYHLDMFDHVRQYLIRFHDKSGNIISESYFDTASEGSLELEDNLLSKRYARTFVYRPKRRHSALAASTQVSARSNGTSDPSSYSLVSKTVESILPRYYHRWLLPPSSRMYISSAALRRDALRYEDEQRILQSLGCSDAKIRKVRELQYLADLEQSRTIKNLRKSAEDFYNRLDFEDLKDLHDVSGK